MTKYEKIIIFFFIIVILYGIYNRLNNVEQFASPHEYIIDKVNSNVQYAKSQINRKKRKLKYQMEKYVQGKIKKPVKYGKKMLKKIVFPKEIKITF